MSFLDRLRVEVGPNGINRTLTHEFRYVTPGGFAVYVPAGFVTDYASIPRLLWRIAPPAHGRHIWAAVLHDWLYRTPGINVTRAQADGVFLDAMKTSNMSLWKRQAIYRAVRMFGGSSFAKRTI